MRRLSKLFALILAVSLTMAVASCQSAFNLGETSPAIDAESVTGTWSARGPDGQVSTIELRENGSALISGLPAAVVTYGEGPPDWSDTIGSEGSWSVNVQTEGQVWSVNISGQYAFGLVSIGDDDGHHLAAYIGDPDARVRIFFDQD